MRFAADGGGQGRIVSCFKTPEWSHTQTNKIRTYIQRGNGDERYERCSISDLYILFSKKKCFIKQSGSEVSLSG